MTCATCKHGQPAPRYPAEHRHCALASEHYRLPVSVCVFATCPPELGRWERAQTAQIGPAAHAAD